MAIQLRRGDYTDFDPSRLLDGELAVVLENDPDTDDGTGLYACFGDDNVKRVAFADEAADVPIATTTTAGIVKPDGTSITVDSNGTIHGASTVTPSSIVPEMDGIATAGRSTDYARGDHRHPSDTSRASASELNTHTSDTTAHVTQAERAAWDAKYDAEVATENEIGLVKPDGETMTVDESGTLSGIVVKHSDGSKAGPILSLSAKGWAEQDSTTDPPSPSPDYPQEIRVCRGRNLLDDCDFTANAYVGGTEGAVHPSSSSNATGFISVAEGDFAFSYVADTFVSLNERAIVFYNANKSYHSSTQYIPSVPNLAHHFVVPSGVKFVRITIDKGMTNYQLERGSTAHPYVPYGDYVGLDVYDGNTHVSTTPIPLPSRGWVASLPDGTADTLTLDGAGKVTWERKTNETTQAVTDGVTGTVGVDVLSSTGQIADGATVLYKPATPVTEDDGYIEMPEIPVGAEISIPELDDLGVDYIIPLPVVLQGYEDRIAALEAAIAEIIAGS